MSTTRCYKPGCNQEVEISCSCTSPEIYSCNEHLKEHCTSKGNHNFDSIFYEPAESTKIAISSLLAEESQNIEKIKRDIITTFYQTLLTYENIFKKTLKEIDSDITKMHSSAEKISQVKRLSKFEKDADLNLLALQPNEAAKIAKKILQRNQIKISSCSAKWEGRLIKFFEVLMKKSRYTSSEIMFGLKSLEERLNFEKELMDIYSELNIYKNMLRVDPTNVNAYNCMEISSTMKRDVKKHYNIITMQLDLMQIKQFTIIIKDMLLKS
ncbi:unnamed protein product [Blepharisma stoltei]|uniref:Uncharacterized protein n=1 Tax=Blepharisma stoltei TaxID=1481888 RepID=A0AAU9IH55_9CILI|nr:unnamed protein product [Blepharisma stoltei]